MGLGSLIGNFVKTAAKGIGNYAMDHPDQVVGVVERGLDHAEKKKQAKLDAKQQTELEEQYNELCFRIDQLDEELNGLTDRTKEEIQLVRTSINGIKSDLALLRKKTKRNFIITNVIAIVSVAIAIVLAIIL